MAIGVCPARIGRPRRARHKVGQKAEDVAAHYYAEVELATLPRDRWGHLGLNPGVDHGTLCSVPFELPAASQVRVNGDGISGLSVDLLDEHFQPIAGPTVSQVCWSGRTSIQPGDTPVRVRVNMQRRGGHMPKVYPSISGRSL